MKMYIYIRRIQKDEMALPIVEEHYDSVNHYNGQKNPMMVQSQLPINPLDFKTHEDVSTRRAEETDFAFFQDVITSPDCPECNGYNTKQRTRPYCKTKNKSGLPTTNRHDTFRPCNNDDSNVENTADI